MKSLRLTALAAALVLGACSSPTPTDPAISASRPSFDGGGMVGSGNFTGETEDGGNTLGSGNGIGTGGTEDGGGMIGSGNRTESTDSTGRGGNTLGSGN
jgi:hypothetical protein